MQIKDIILPILCCLIICAKFECKQNAKNCIKSSRTKSKSSRSIQSSRRVLSGIYSNSGVAMNNHSLWSGDIILTEEQEQDLNSDTEEYASVKMDSAKWWPRGQVYYRIHKSVLNTEVNVKKAMEKWENNTCIEFVDISESKMDHYIEIKKTGSGCFSYVGMAHPAQPVSLDTGCETVNTVAHELGHALGMWHEHTRPDRDEYLIIYLNNVAQKQVKNFNIPLDVLMGGSPYDFSSVMHYDFYAFSSNNRMTMVPKDPLVEAEMYNGDKPSYHDYVLINKVYNCDVACEYSTLVCKNGGFRTANKDRRCICVCKHGFEGNNCENQVTTILCGGKYDTAGVISSPNYPNQLPFDKKCVYWLQAPKGRRARIKFLDFELNSPDKDNECSDEYLQIRSTNIFGDDPGEIFCSDELKDDERISQQENLLLVLKTGVHEPNKGFQGQFSIV